MRLGDLEFSKPRLLPKNYILGVFFYKIDKIHTSRSYLLTCLDMPVICFHSLSFGYRSLK